MGLVFAAAVSHAPGITARAEEEPEEIRRRVYGNYERVRIELERSRPDLILVIANDHITYMFEIIPQFLIPIVDEYEGPAEHEWLRIPRYRVSFDREFSVVLLNSLIDEGFDIAFSENPMLDHATMNPLHFLASDRDRGIIKYPVVVLLTNVFKRPVPRLTRAYQLGQAMGRIIGASDRRVAVVATGGLSHDPGGPRWGYVDVEFDRKFLNALSSGDVKYVTGLTPDEVFKTGGGSYEILNWTIAWGVVGGEGCDVIDYVPSYNIGSAWVIWR